MMDHCNLLPYDFQRRLLIQTQVRRWSFVCGLTAVALLALTAQRVHFLSGHETRLQQMEQRCIPLRKLLAESKGFKDRLGEMNGRELLAGELQGARYPLELLGFISRTAHPFAQDLQIRQFTLHHFVRPVPVAPKSKDAPPPPPQPELINLTLAGIATDGLVVARFVTVLRESRVFESVELKMSLPGKIRDLPTREYQLTCTF